MSKHNIYLTVKFKPGKLGLCIEQTQNQVSDEKSEGVKRYVRFNATAHLYMFPRTLKGFS
jgi:hypothetical protein